VTVFRVEKTRDYTVMSNSHFKDKRLSLKAKGLLSLMLSLPPEWDFSLRGLTKLGTDGIDSIRNAVNELENAKYIVRSRARNEKGQLKGTEYIIYEQPLSELPTLAKPTLEKPTLAEPMLEKATQLSNKAIKEKEDKILSLSSTHSFFPPETDGMTDITELRNEILARIEYEHISTSSNRMQLDEFVELMLEVELTQSQTIKIGKDIYPAGFVRERFSKLDSEHIQKVLEGISENATRVRNTKAYIMAALFNAPASIDNHYTMLVNHDLFNGSR